MKKIVSAFALSCLLWGQGLPTAQAQCPMCKMSAESNLNDGGRAASGLNKGILYLLILPYAMMATLGYVWYRNRMALVQAEQERSLRDLLDMHQITLSDQAADEIK